MKKEALWLQNRRIFVIEGLLLVVVATLVFFLSYPPPPLPPDDQAKKIIDDCGRRKDKENCFITAFVEIGRSQPIQYSLQVLSSLRTMDKAANGCHFIAHIIAGEAVRKNPAGWESVLGKITASDCTGGFLMGVMEAHKQYNKQFSLSAATMPEVCQKVNRATKNAEDDQTCMHIMGHLLLIDKKGVVGDAIRVCQQTALQYQYECSAGVFMENLYRRNLAAHGVGSVFPWVGKALAEQEKLCSSYTSLTARACWRELSHMYVVLGKTPQRVFVFCQRASLQADQDACYLHAVGVMTLLADNQTSLNELCVPYSDQGSECLEVVVNALLDSSAELAGKAAAYCESLPDRDKKVCLTVLKQR